MSPQTSERLANLAMVVLGGALVLAVVVGSLCGCVLMVHLTYLKITGALP